MDGVWVREPKEGAGVVIFVHGILSSGETCWKHGNGAYWPTLLSGEESLSDLGIYVYTYQTSVVSGYYSVSDVVGDLKERLKSADTGKGTIWRGGGPMLFVCHSMGGIVVRKLIVRNQVELIEAGARIGLFLIASPSLGSSYANWIAAIARAAGHTQALALAFGQGNQWLNELDVEFQTLKETARIPMVGRELQEDKFVLRGRFGLLFSQVVEPFSAHRYFGDPLKISQSDHFSISKPESRTALAHSALVRFLTEDATRLASSTPGGLLIPGRNASLSSAASEASPPSAIEPDDDWPDEGVTAFVCITERGPTQATVVTSFDDYCAEFGPPLPAERSYSGLSLRGFFENGGACAVVGRAVGRGSRAARACVESDGARLLVLSARDVGVFGNRLQVEISPATRKGLRVRIRDARPDASAQQATVLEDFDNVPVDGGSAVSRFIQYVGGASRWIRGSLPEETSTHGSAVLPSGIWQCEGGSDGTVTAESLLGTVDAGAEPSGLSGLTGCGAGLVCIPDAAQSWLDSEDRQRLQSALSAHCAQELAVAVVAAGRPGDDLTDVLAPCDSSTAIAVWPWLLVASPDVRRTETVPPDGHLAGAIARSDRRRGVHAPAVACALAGTLGTVPSIVGGREQLADLALDASRRGVNLVAMPEGTSEVFLQPLITTAVGTNDRESSRSRLRVFILRRVRQVAARLMFPGQRGSQLEEEIVEQIEAFLSKLWTKGGLGGASPAEAYRVALEEAQDLGRYRLTLELTWAPDYHRENFVLLFESWS